MTQKIGPKKVQVTLTPEMQRRLENWRASQSPIPSEAEALRLALNAFLPVAEEFGRAGLKKRLKRS